MKPNPLKLVPPVDPQDRIAKARARFAKSFAHEPGSTWKPKETPVLTTWLSNRKHTK